MKPLSIVLAQINTTVGDIRGNLNKHLDAIKIANEKHQADLIVFPELSLTGYPPEDLLFRDAFLDESNHALQTLIQQATDIYIAVGHPEISDGKRYNTCSIIHNQKIIGKHHKNHLPNYGVFDEMRYFTPHDHTTVVNIRNTPVGVVICEDLWYKEPVASTIAAGAKIIISPNASPFRINKHEERLNAIKQHNIPIAYVNLVGGQDELIFDGGSMFTDASGQIQQFAGFYHEALLASSASLSPSIIPERSERVYQALVLAIRDYIQKNHFKGALIGVSGGIDSALTLALAVDALGNKAVDALIMPSRYTSAASIEDAESITRRLGVKTHTLSIEPIFNASLETLKPIFTNDATDLTEENLQARCRALLLMAESNKHGKLVLTTGNRSELATGYCTLYGDMAGGFAPLRDVPKTLVYELAKYRNTLSTVIPERTIERAPTAELAPDQKDEDTLPPYPLLDAILEDYLNNGLSIEQIVKKGLDRQQVIHVVNLIYKSEYKRRQAAVGPRIRRHSFGKDWRYPVTHRFRETTSL